MMIQILRAKIHHVTVTDASLHYRGSLTLDEALIEAAGMVEFEKIQVVNVNNGERIETYLIKGARDSGVCCLNGPAARKGAVGDTLIVISYGLIEAAQAKDWKPTILFPKTGNTL